MDLSKVSGVKDWPVPTKVKHVQAFLGLANFYHRFIKDFAKIVRLLTILTCKDQPWIWNEEQQLAFDTLKEAFTSAPILQIPVTVFSRHSHICDRSRHHHWILLAKPIILSIYSTKRPHVPIGSH
jgi:hypothetical protein